MCAEKQTRHVDGCGPSRSRKHPGMRKVRDEDYLIAIEQLCAEAASERARSGQIAKALGIANGTASSMLLHLAAQGLIDHQPYEGAKLTDLGRSRSQKVIRRQQIIEMLLSKLLHWDRAASVDEVRQLEPVVSDKLIDAVDSFLGFPAYTFTGELIPRQSSATPESESRQQATGPED